MCHKILCALFFVETDSGQYIALNQFCLCEPYYNTNDASFDFNVILRIKRYKCSHRTFQLGFIFVAGIFSQSQLYDKCSKVGYEAVWRELLAWLSIYPFTYEYRSTWCTCTDDWRVTFVPTCANLSLKFRICTFNRSWELNVNWGKYKLG